MIYLIKFLYDYYRIYIFYDIMELVCIEDYWLEGKNRYYVNSEKFWITKDELIECWVINDKAYLNKSVCENLKLLNIELISNHWLKLVIKDAYRSEKLYKLIVRKREEKEWKEFVSNSFNTKWDFPHSTWNSVDISFVSIHTWEQLFCVKDIDDINERRKSWRVIYYENSLDKNEQIIHKNRIFMREMMSKYWFEWIDHEYWHFNYVL